MSLFRSISDGLTEHARRQALAYVLAFLLAVGASITAFVDNFLPLTRDQMAAMAWWQVLALLGKCVSPAVAAIVALLVKSPVGQSVQTKPPFSP